MCLQSRSHTVVENISTQSEANFYPFRQIKWQNFRENFEKKNMYWSALFFVLFCNLLTGHISMELYDQLQHLINYVKNHTESQQPDLMLGMYICEGIWHKKNNNNNTSITNFNLQWKFPKKGFVILSSQL